MAPSLRNRPALPLALAVTLVIVGAWGVARLFVLREAAFPLTYVLPLLLHVWTRRPWLLWLTAGGFLAMATAKLWVGDADPDLPGWAAQAAYATTVVNVAVAAVVTRLIMALREGLEGRNAKLEQFNAELAEANRQLASRQEQVSRQNHELEAQAEELSSQNEEIRAQHEELARQTGEIEAQAVELARRNEELEALNRRLAGREQMLQALLDLSGHDADGEMMLTEVCRRARTLLGRQADTVVLLERRAEGGGAAAAAAPPGMAVLAESSAEGAGPVALSLGSGSDSLVELILRENRTAYIDDVSKRPDLALPLRPATPTRSVLASPVRGAGGKASGVVLALGGQVTHWTDEQFRVIEWVAAQCASVLDGQRERRSLRESEARLRAFVESNVIGILTADVEGRILECNEELARIIGRPRAEVLAGGVRWTEITPAEDLPLDERSLAEARASGSCTPYEKRYVRPDGTRVPVLLGYTLLEPERTRAVAFVLDLSERKRLEEDIRRAKEAAEAASRAKDHFLATLSHELRTPLTPVLAAAMALTQDERLPEDAREDAAMIRRNVNLETRLIDDLLDLTRVSRGKLQLEVRPVDLADLLRQTAGICSCDLDAKGLRLTLSTAECRPCTVMADPARLQQVFWNLIKNAVKFTPEHGAIGIRMTVEGGGGGGGGGEGAAGPGFAVVEVSDTGKGIEPELLPVLFNAFEQGDQNTARQFGGLGLGLAICKALVELHGGTIAAHSEGPGRGATFTVRLPAAAVAPAAPPGSPAPAMAGGGAGGGAGAGDGRGAARGPRLAELPSDRPLRILLVEDHSDTARLMGRLLRGEGHEVETAPTVTEALDLADRHEFDLLVSDLGLPDGTGIDLMRQLRGRGRPIRGIVMSGYGTEEDVRRSREVGFLAHLTKPVNIDRLSEAIRNLSIGPGPIGSGPLVPAEVQAPQAR